MRLSVVIGSHNEGDRLWRTVDSVVESAGGLEYELIVVDDGITVSGVSRLPESR
jgi:glycosyltransferase involved in cell wall biosynthesis